jgi:penicillin-binding protein 2
VTNLEREKHAGTGKRMNVLFLLIFVSLAILIFRLSFIQLSRGEMYLARAENNRYITQTIPAPRGLIYDRNNKELVGNKPANVITFQKLSEKIQDPMMLIGQLSEMFKMSPSELYDKMDPDGEKYSFAMPRKIVTNATDEQVAYVREHADELPGINVVQEPIRVYWEKELASHVLGYLNNIPKDFWEAHQDEYQQTDKTGWAGVEKQYEEYLHGKDGKLKVEVNINSQPLGKGKTTEEPIKGADVYLTIDSDMQRATQDALAKQVEELHKTTKTVTEGAAIAMNPKTGEILSMASYPYFDPNQSIGGWSNDYYEKVFSKAEKNRAIQERYLPGSTIKMSTVLIGLKEGAITPNETIYDPGYIYFGNAKIASWITGLGSLDARKALAVSSNVYMIETFRRFGKFQNLNTPSQVEYYLNNTLPAAMDKMLNYHKEFGLGEQKTGVDLPYEVAGTVTREGYASDIAFSSFGQSENYTLMQLAQFVSTIANDGKRMEPHIVKEIKSTDGKVVKEIQPKMQNQLSFTQDQLKVVQEGMRDVIAKPYGTFSSVFANYPIAVAGKTGTAETNINNTENSLFVGYAPYDDPQIAIAIILPMNEHNSHSYNSVGPVAKAMMDAYFKLNQKPATDQNAQKKP